MAAAAHASTSSDEDDDAKDGVGRRTILVFVCSIDLLGGCN